MILKFIQHKLNENMQLLKDWSEPLRIKPANI